MDYLVAAFDLLAEGGDAALTTTNVCARLGVTTGSLYHHFGGGPAFYAAVVDHWENEASPAIWRQADEAGDVVDRLQALHHIAVTGNHAAEKAIRAWAARDPMVAAAQRRVDDARERHLTEAYVAAGVPAERAATMARIGFAILVGSQQLDIHLDRERLTTALDEYRHWVATVVLEGLSD